jgi:hypothetical protein
MLSWRLMTTSDKLTVSYNTGVSDVSTYYI